MARHNFVSVIGFVKKMPVFHETVDGQVGLIAIKTIMSDREYFKAKTGYQNHSVSFCLRTQENALIEKLKNLELFDVISVTGFLATKERDKEATCPVCGTVNSRIDACLPFGQERVKSGGNDIYVYPISLHLESGGNDEQSAFEYLHAHKEDVNRVFIMGNLTSPPVHGALDQGKRLYTRYQIAVNRKYHPKGGDELYERTDYPWIYSYGNKAAEDYQNLTKGALVFVDGALQSRKYKEQYTCKNCKNEFDVPGRTLEVLSYDTEYLRLPTYEATKNKNEQNDTASE